jgi:hypothetical protein
LKPTWAKYFTRPYLENTQYKKRAGVAQVLEHLPTKCEALTSNPSTAKKIKVRPNSYTHKYATYYFTKFGKQALESLRPLHLPLTSSVGTGVTDVALGFRGCQATATPEVSDLQMGRLPKNTSNSKRAFPKKHVKVEVTHVFCDL